LEKKYWEKRYASGGTSGPGSIGADREWKWRVITEFLTVVNHVIDIGCGDLTFWEGRDCRDYTGLDASETIIDKNRLRRPGWSFINALAEKRIAGLNKECVFCFDLLFHIMDVEAFITILENLCLYSTKHIFIHTWMYNPFSRRRQIKLFLINMVKGHMRRSLYSLKTALFTPYTDGNYQYFRQLEKYFYLFEKNGFELLEKRRSPNNFGGMYVFIKGKG
jgi:hypothetical protein